MALVALPALLVWGHFAPLSTDAIKAAFGAAAVVAIYGLLAAVARGRGHDVQVRLTALWGGLPTTTMLRHRDSRLNAITKNRYHDALRRLGFEIPSITEEAADPVGADACFETAMDDIRRRAKASGAKLVARENISFGFVRNLLGLKPLALVVSAISFGAFALFYLVQQRGAPGIAEYGLLCVLFFHALLITTLVTQTLVQQHAESYARALFEEIIVASER